MPELIDAIAELFQSHGVQTTVQNGVLTFAGHAFQVTANTGNETQISGGVTLQLDVSFAITAGQVIVESFAGIGATREEALGSAVVGFANGALHVLLGSFFGVQDEHAVHEQWQYEGRPRRVVISHPTMRGKVPADSDRLVNAIESCMKLVQTLQLDSDTHWVRVVYGQNAGKPVAFEFLVDNLPRSDFRSAVESYGWPAEKEFYIVRLFLVIERDGAGLSSPSAIIREMIQIVAANSKLDQTDVCELLVKRGAEAKQAQRAFELTQIAWGRLLMQGTGVTFSPEYYEFNAAGDLVRTGMLADDPYFIAATSAYESLRTRPVLEYFALSSADVSAVNQALQNGSSLKDLVCGPAGLFLDPPDHHAMEKAQQTISQILAKQHGKPGAGNTSESAPRQPWWKLRRK